MKVLSVSFDVFFRGQGIVNRNDSAKEHGEDVLRAKKIGEFPYVSRDCILREVLAEPFGFKFLSQSKSPMERFEVNISKYRMLRGNLDASESAVLKRKSPISMTDAVATEKCDRIYRETKSKGNMGGYFVAEEVGNTHLKSRVAINLSDLQFVSTDGMLDAAVVNRDEFSPTNRGQDQIRRIWQSNYPHTPFPTVAYYNKQSPQQDNRHLPAAFQTEGVKISDRDVAELLMFLIDSLKGFSLEKRKAYLQFDMISNIELRTSNGVKRFQDVQELVDILQSPDFQVLSAYAETTERRDYKHIMEAISASKERAKEEKEAVKTKGKEARAAREEGRVLLTPVRTLKVNHTDSEEV